MKKEAILRLAHVVLLPGVIFSYLLATNIWFWAQVPGAPNVFGHASEWRDYFGQGDGGSYLMVAQDLVKDFSIDINNRWALQLWPPGMPFLEYLIIALAGPKALLLTLAGLTSALWTYFLVLFVKQNADSMGRRKVLTAVLILCVFTQLPVATWTGASYLFNSEPIGLGLFGVAFLKLWPSLVLNQNYQKSHLRCCAQAGCFIGIAAYFRAPFFLLGLAMITAFLLQAFILLGRRCIRKESDNSFIVAAILFATSFGVVVAPWLIISANTVRPGIISWTQSDDMGTRAWLDKSDPTMPAWYSSSGPGWACDIAPKECAQLLVASPGNKVLQKRAIHAVIAEPMKFVFNRTRYFVRAAFLPLSGIATLFETLVNITTILFLPISVVVQLFRRKFFGAIMITAVTISLLIPPSVYHFEPRYLAPLKILGGLLLIQEIMRWDKRHSEETGPESQQRRWAHE